MGKKLLFKSAVETALMILDGKVTSEEVTMKLLEQVEKHNKKYNCIVTLNPHALNDAKKADTELSKGKIPGKLHGVPITLKDNYNTDGLLTTSAYLPLKNNIPKEDAEIVRLLKSEGAIIIGKTNLSVLAMDMQTDNPVFGKTNNPWDVSCTSGGSSGGCAAALAGGMSFLGFGNDLAGSIRIPSAYCGIYGFKPSFKVVSMRGIQLDPKEKVNGMQSLAVPGPLARNIADLELAMDIIAQNTNYDGTLIPLNRNPSHIEIGNLKIAWTDSFQDVPVDREIQDAIRVYVEKLHKAGMKVENTMPELNFYQAWKTWGSFVGMQAGYDTPNFIKWLGMPFTKGILKNVPIHQNIVKPASVKKYMIAINTQNEMITKMANFFNKYDVFICPVSAITAFPHHKPTSSYGNFNIYQNPLKVNGQDIHYYMATQGYTTPFNLTENPVLSMPITISKKSLPIGIQVVGKRYGDFRLIKIGKVLSEFAEEISYPLEKSN